MTLINRSVRRFIHPYKSTKNVEHETVVHLKVIPYFNSSRNDDKEKGQTIAEHSVFSFV